LFFERYQGSSCRKTPNKSKYKNKNVKTLESFDIKNSFDESKNERIDSIGTLNYFDV
jgi:hypothetical protein